MSQLDASYWTARYESQSTGWDMGSVGPLKNILDEISDKQAHILIPGAGNGHEADYALQCGFTNLHILDYSPIPLDNLKKRLPEFPENQLHCQDFFEHQGIYDYILEQTFFCALDPELRSNYVQKMAALLKPSGILTGVLFNFPLESGPPFGGDAESYTELFENAFKIDKLEPCSFSVPPRMGKELHFKFKKASTS